MSTRQLVTLVDDLDGSEADETIEFGWDGKPLVIDLNGKHAERFRSVVAKYVEAARPLGTIRATGPRLNGRRPGRPASSGNPLVDAAAARRGEVRAWAMANPGTLRAAGVPPIAERGRINTKVYALYEARPR